MSTTIVGEFRISQGENGTWFLLGKDGEFEGSIDYGEDQKTAAEKIRRLAGA